MASTSTIEGMIEALRAVSDPTKVSAQLASAAVPYVQEAMQQTLGAGTSPSGEAWAPTKKGGRAYSNAASKVTTASNGDLLTITVKGPEAFADRGVKGHLPRRPMLPDGGAGVPTILSEALGKGLDDLMAKLGVTK